MGVSGLGLWPYMWNTVQRFSRKTQKGPSKYDKLLKGCILLPPWLNLCQSGQQVPSVVGNNEVSGKIYGLAYCLLFHRAYAPHTITLPGSSGESREWGLRSLPLVVRDILLYSVYNDRTKL